jgi:hypothetical protein
MSNSNRTKRPHRTRALVGVLLASSLMCAATTVALADSPRSSASTDQSNPSKTSEELFEPVVPSRVLDTREGMGAPKSKRAAGSTLQLKVTGGAAKVADNAAAVVVNVTGVDPDTNGFVTVWPCGSDRPTASNLNLRAGQTIPNLVISEVGANGTICLYNHTATHLVADITGWYPAAATFEPVVPSRVLDTREGMGAPKSKRAAGSTLQLKVTGGAAKVADNAAAVVVNVTGVDPDTNGFVTVWPCGSDRPTASNLNLRAGQTIPNLVISEVGANGTICLYNHTATHLVADITGWYPAAATFEPVVPSRVLDTREGMGAPKSKRAAGSTLQLKVTGGAAKVADNAAAVVVNVTGVDPDTNGFVTVWPCGSDRPTASNLNLRAGQTIPNLVISEVGANGTICLYNHTATHLVADITGWFPPKPSGTPEGGGDTTVDSGSSGIAGETGQTELLPPTGGSGFVPGPNMVAARASTLAPPSTLDGGQQAEVSAPLMQTFVDPDLNTRSTGGDFTEVWGPHQPTYRITASGYVTRPDRAVGRLIMWNLRGGVWTRANSCSGTVVARTMVLTAAHCLHDANDRYFDGYTFVPGLAGYQEPHGAWSAAGSRAFHPTAYDQYRNGIHGILFDYALIKFDPVYNGGRSIGDFTGAFGIYQGAADTPNKYAIGYPDEGFFTFQNNGWCLPSMNWCFAWHCNAPTSSVANYGNGWRAVGFGCNGNGGISGGGIFSLINGKWWVVSVVSQGGAMRDRNGGLCPVPQTLEVRRTCNWYMSNSWGPEFRSGAFDTFFHQVDRAGDLR